MYIVVIAIDSWHLANGIHQPSLDVYHSENLSDCLEKCFNRWSDIKDFNGHHIDDDYVYNKMKDNNCVDIEVAKPREGWLIIEHIGE